MSIYGDIEELQDLDIEIKRMNKQLKELRLNKKQTEEKIIKFLEEKDQLGFKHKGLAITLVPKQCRSRKNISEKKDELMKVLQEHRDPTSKEALDEILESLKGDPYTRNCLKIQKIKDI